LAVSDAFEGMNSAENVVGFFLSLYRTSPSENNWAWADSPNSSWWNYLSADCASDGEYCHEFEKHFETDEFCQSKRVLYKSIVSNQEGILLSNLDKWTIILLNLKLNLTFYLRNR
jgi:hypothetical protein